MRAHLLIADISGYTRFMNEHPTLLSHAQQVIADLLTAVLDSGEPLFKLAKLEGDAAFLYAEEGGKPLTADQVQEKILAIRRGFLLKQRQLIADNICTCEPCTSIP